MYEQVQLKFMQVKFSGKQVAYKAHFKQNYIRPKCKQGLSKKFLRKEMKLFIKLCLHSRWYKAQKRALDWTQLWMTSYNLTKCAIVTQIGSKLSLIMTEWLQRGKVSHCDQKRALNLTRLWIINHNRVKWAIITKRGLQTWLNYHWPVITGPCLPLRPGVDFEFDPIMINQL